MPAPRQRFLAIIIPVLALGAASWWLLLRGDDSRRTLVNVLRVELPPSVRHVECVSWGFTDVLTKCAFVVDPQDFPTLLNGWSFAPFQCEPQHSQEAVGGPEVGPLFAAAECFSAHPREFTDGGRVFVVVNAERTRGVVDLYIE